MKSVPLRDIFLLLFLALIWGSSFAAIKVAVETMPPMTMVAVRTVLALCVLFPIMFIQHSTVPRDLRSWVMGFVLGVFGLALPFFLIGWGEQRVPSGLAAILMAVMPIFTIAMAHFFTEGDPINWQKLIGIALGFLGIIVLVGPEALRGIEGQIWHQLAIAGAAVCYAINVILTRNLPGHGSLIGRAVMVMICGTIISVPLAFVLDGPYAIIDASEQSLWITFYLGVLPTGFATIIYFHLVEARGASFFSFVNYLNPVFGVVWGALLLSEIIKLEALLALMIILFGVAISSRTKKVTDSDQSVTERRFPWNQKIHTIDIKTQTMGTDRGE